MDKTESRRVYDDYNEDLEPFFARGVPDGAELERDAESGKVKYSFINLLSLVRPLVIVDEAHNNKSPLSLEVMNRIRPSCVVVKEPPALSHLDAAERDCVTVRPTADGHTEIVLSARITDAALRKVEQALKPADRASLREQMAIRRRQERRRNCPAEKGATFEVPQLMIRLDGALYPVDEEKL